MTNLGFTLQEKLQNARQSQKEYIARLESKGIVYKYTPKYLEESKSTLQKLVEIKNHTMDKLKNNWLQGLL